MKEERKVFTDTLARIVEAVAPEKIICYGNRTDYHESWSSFLPEGSARFSTYYDLLIIVRDDYEENILEIIESCNKPPIHITVVMRSISSFNELIECGDPFFVTLYYKGMMVYDSNRTALANPHKEHYERRITYETESSWKRLITLAKKYHTIAIMCTHRNAEDLNEMSAFMLHQSAENVFRAIIKYYIGYSERTHDLDRLLSLMRNFTLEGDTVFPQTTHEEIGILDWLNNTYHDVRNGHDYGFTLKTIGTLEQRVKLLMEIAEKLYQAKKKLVQL